MSDYVKQLERQNDEIQQKLARSEEKAEFYKTGLEKIGCKYIVVYKIAGESHFQTHRCVTKKDAIEQVKRMLGMPQIKYIVVHRQSLLGFIGIQILIRFDNNTINTMIHGKDNTISFDSLRLLKHSIVAYMKKDISV